MEKNDIEKVSETLSSDTLNNKKNIKKYKPTDLIPCMSIVSGELGMEGIKTHINYRWSEYGDITEVEYQDLLSSIRRCDSFVMKPYFIIQDKEIVSQFPNIQKLYDSMYSVKDLKDILGLNPFEMKKVIETLPNGAKESVKNIAVTQISNGQLDSVKKIKLLDEIFGTEMIMLTNLFS